MIVRTFDYGWGPEWKTKQFEQSLLDKYLHPLATDSSRTIVINSVWYGQQQHADTCRELRQLSFDRIVLVAMIDAAIPCAEWFVEFDCPVETVGYYAGRHELDYWALLVAQYFNQSVISNQLIDTPFMCLNRKPHWHRRQLYQKLVQKNLVNIGIVSMGGDEDFPVQQQLAQDAGGTDIAPNAGIDTHGIVNDIMSLGHTGNWNRHLLNVVTETNWNIDQNRFVSEKIFKPILGQRPFVVYDPNGARDWLSERGFKDYTDDFKDISDLDPGDPEQLVDFLVVLSAQSPEWFGNKLLALQDKIMYNYTQFERYVAQQQYLIQQGIQCQI